MKKLICLSMTFATVGCATVNDSQIQSAIEKNPDIVFSAIEKHPEKFMAIVQKAAQSAQRKEQENAEKSQRDAMEKEFKNPLKPEMGTDRIYKGAVNAPITIVEYADFQCPYCVRGFGVMNQVLEAYKGKVRVLFKNLPLPMHAMAVPAAKRYEAIGLQDKAKATAFHDELFKNADKLNSDGEKYLDALAKKLKVDLVKMKKDMDSPVVKSRMEADAKEAESFDISGTPGYIVDGVSVRGAYPFETFKQIIDRKLAEKK